jgi:hypothetical protein
VLGRIAAIESQLHEFSQFRAARGAREHEARAQSDARLRELGEELARVQQHVRDLVQADELRFELETSQRRAAVAMLTGAHEQLDADSRQLARWLDGVLGLTRATFESLRWRIGDRIVRLIELLLLRARPRLARHFIEETERNFREWRAERVDVRALVQRLHAQLLETTPAGRWRLPAGAPGSLAALSAADAGSPSVGGMHVPSKLDASLRDVICFPVIDWHFRVQRPQHVARVLGARGHRVFYLCLEPETGAERSGFELLESPEANVWIARLRVRRRKAPNVYRDVLQGDALADYVDALDALRRALDIRTPVAIVDLPFWRPLVESVPGAVMIYDCMDHHAGFSTNTA